MDNFKIIYKILKHLERELDCEYSDPEGVSHEKLDISRPRWEQILIMLQKEGYIEGILVNRTCSDDRGHVIEPVHALITLKGLEYLSENSAMKKAEKLLKGVSAWI